MLVNGIYDPRLFGLRYTDSLETGDGTFWSSQVRYATVDSNGNYLSADNGGSATTEYLELDYGRVRQVMGLMMDIIRLPFDITIEYDAVSASDGSHSWVAVTPESGLTFDDMILYEAQATSSFIHSEFYFSDARSNMVHTRFLRIGFTRRDTAWPTRANLGIPYPAIVKNLRTFRTVSEHKHMAGPLFVSEIDSSTSFLQLTTKPDLSTHEITQRFTFPVDAPRGEGTTTTGDDIVPSLLGFSFLTEVESGSNGDAGPTGDAMAKWRWSLWDVTASEPVELDRGLTTGTANVGQCWVDCYFHNPILGDMNTTYEIRLSSRYTPTCSGVYTNNPVDVPGFLIPSTLSAERRSRLLVVDDTVAGTGLLQIGDYIQAIDGLNSYQVLSMGESSGYVTFDGVSGRIDVDYAAALNTSSWSASLWYRTSAERGTESVMMDNSNELGEGWRIGIGPDGGSLNSAVQVTCDGQTLYDIADTADGEWHHIGVKFDNGTGILKAFRDGVSLGTLTGITYTPNSTGKLCFGTKWGSDWDNLVYGSGEWSDPGTRFEGDLDDGAVFNANLTDQNLIDIYDLGHGGDQTLAVITGYASNVGLWQFNDDVGSLTALDQGAAVATYNGTVQISGVSFLGEQTGQYVIEVNRGWREASDARTFFIVPRMTYVADGTLHRDYSRNLALRVWTDTGDSGRDILGNQYRYATRLLDSASKALDPASSGWMSAPRPSADAVESLYFDVRQAQQTGQNEFAVIDNIRIAPRTHGVRMHVYYTRDNLHGDAPTDTDHWDHMLWTPINEIYELRRDEVIQLPYGVQASFIKLEFTNLRPMPFAVSPFPELPPVEYKRHPTWVENAFENTQLRNVVEDWFVQTNTPVQRRLLKELADPIKEFAYKQREFMTALSQGRVNDPRIIGSGLVDEVTGVFIDPVTSSKIRINSNGMYQGSLLATIRDRSLLGKAVAARSQEIAPFTREAQPTLEQTSSFVSTRGDRVTHSFSTLAETPMWFNRRCRHYYRTDKARFNRKAYYVGIRDVEFRRNDYTVEFDDPIIDDNLYDDEFLDLNSFVREPMTKIADGQEVYVSYKVGDTEYTDEAVTLNGSSFIDLVGVGAVASGIEVWSLLGKKGVRYDVDMDYIISHAYEIDGDITTQIARSDQTEYLEVNPEALYGLTYRDSGVAFGLGTASEAS